MLLTARRYPTRPRPGTRSPGWRGWCRQSRTGRHHLRGTARPPRREGGGVRHAGSRDSRTAAGRPRLTSAKETSATPAARVSRVLAASVLGLLLLASAVGAPSAAAGQPP